MIEIVNMFHLILVNEVQVLQVGDKFCSLDFTAVLGYYGKVIFLLRGTSSTPHHHYHPNSLNRSTLSDVSASLMCESMFRKIFNLCLVIVMFNFHKDKDIMSPDITTKLVKLFRKKVGCRQLKNN